MRSGAHVPGPNRGKAVFMERAGVCGVEAIFAVSVWEMSIGGGGEQRSYLRASASDIMSSGERT